MSSKMNPIRDLRQKEGLTQLELAVRAGLSLGTVNIAERSGRVTLGTAEKLAKALKVKPDTFKNMVQ